MSEQTPDPATTELASKLLESMLQEAGDDDLCPHCVGLELIYLVSREMTANTDVEPGELFSAIHAGIVDGEALPEDAAQGGEREGGKGWTVH